ncbi:hypothetical protein [Parashewanella tropica]|uniref:hypothetical protein n=1 Tax=Parashewanella tropica TaxID=2547970 RepID=UPI0010598348|nr:hypothetical protein [Parashewanella tropica]
MWARVDYQAYDKDGFCYIETETSHTNKGTQTRQNAAPSAEVEHTESEIKSPSKPEPQSRVKLTQAPLEPKAATQEVIPNIEALLSQNLSSKELVQCYQQFMDQLLRCEAISASRNSGGQLSSIVIEPQLSMMLRKLVFHLVQQRIQEETKLFENNMGCYGRTHSNRGKAYKQEDCLVASYRFVLAHVFCSFPKATNGIETEISRLLMCMSIDKSDTERMQYHRKMSMDNMFTPSDPHYALMERTKAEVNALFDQFEILLFLLHLHPMCHTTQSPDFTTIPDLGVSIISAVDSSIDATQVWKPKLAQLKTLAPQQGTHNTTLCNSHCYRLPAGDYHGILVVHDPEEQKVVLVPFDKHSTEMKKKADKLLASYYTKPVQVLYFSFEQEWPNAFSQLVKAFTCASCGVVAPFREGQNQDEQRKVLSAEEYLLCSQMLALSHKGEVECQFHPKTQQLKLILLKPSSRESLQELALGFPQSANSTKQPNVELLFAAFKFLKLFNDKMCCALSFKNAAEIMNPCMDRYGNIYEESELIKWVLQYKRHPVIAAEPMTTKDIFPVPAIKRLIKSCGAIDSYFQFSELVVPEIQHRQVEATRDVATPESQAETKAKPITVESICEDIDTLIKTKAPTEELVKYYDKVSRILLANPTVKERSATGQITKVGIHSDLIASMRKLAFTIVRRQYQLYKKIGKPNAKMEAYRYLIDTLIFPTLSEEFKPKTSQESKRLMEVMLNGKTSEEQYRQGYSRQRVHENLVPAQYVYVSTLAYYRAKVDPTFDYLELYLFFLDCHPLCSSFTLPDITPIPQAGIKLKTEESDGVKPSPLVWDSKTQLVTADVRDGSVNHILTHHQKYQLSVTLETQGCW